MKNNICKFILFVLFIFIFSENGYSWNSELQTISTNQCYPTSFETNIDFFVFNVSVRVYNVIPIIDPQIYRANLYIVQNGVTTYVGYLPFNGNSTQTLAVNINASTPFCWNKDATLKCIVQDG